MQKIYILFLGILLISCGGKEKNTESSSTQGKESYSLKDGSWRVALTLQDNKELPFIFSTTANGIEIHNAEERISVDDITIKDDSITIKMDVYEGVLKGKFTDATTFSGQFIKVSLDRYVPFTATFGETKRFSNIKGDAKATITGNWETVFSPDAEADRYIAKGIFKQNGNTVTGTFRTTTGDYRFLEGTLNGDQLQLSAFDGAHAFLFTATVTDSTMTGEFQSGNHWKEPFTAKRNETFELPDAKSLTYIKEGYDAFNFSFPDANNMMISLTDKELEGKVRIVQIMGTWCPNCLDESKYYSSYAKSNPDVKFIGLAFEYTKTKEKAFANIERLQKRLNIPYPIVLAQFGTSDKKKAQEKLPMLNHVLSYPTTIFIDKKGKVRRIHTGFNGPATGDKYIAFKKDFENFVLELQNE
ncbi:TlpA family protein disulfide reductase [Kordia sp. YSTF-M3]|uniref:TlpA family protein disulfide reductase n=1 Tax=Kordia aestuariivivens TaxID=2759037 RepID=A0ABR7QCF2_9FLAO|nr:TlpA disulfide reductase family protein [Kordia aestuariivivens]MBC8756252.1 TlpA family protein disulfide reductase [Kordia aestuariivivens]